MKSCSLVFFLVLSFFSQSLSFGASMTAKFKGPVASGVKSFAIMPSGGTGGPVRDLDATFDGAVTFGMVEKSKVQKSKPGELITTESATSGTDNRAQATIDDASTGFGVTITSCSWTGGVAGTLVGEPYPAGTYSYNTDYEMACVGSADPCSGGTYFGENTQNPGWSIDASSLPFIGCSSGDKFCVRGTQNTGLDGGDVLGSISQVTATASCIL